MWSRYGSWNKISIESIISIAFDSTKMGEKSLHYSFAYCNGIRHFTLLILFFFLHKILPCNVYFYLKKCLRVYLDHGTTPTSCKQVLTHIHRTKRLYIQMYVQMWSHEHILYKFISMVIVNQPKRFSSLFSSFISSNVKRHLLVDQKRIHISISR